MRPLLFISDLHLDDASPDTLAMFERFCRGPARRAGALYILGDLFEAWAGDDVLDQSARRVAKALRQLTSTGTATYMLHGNRDFLLGAGFAEACSMTLLPDPSTLTVGDRRVVLCHGDALCTQDHAYQAIRRALRDPVCQTALLAKPRAQRKALARQARETSRATNANKPEGIMDVDPNAVEAMLDAEDAAAMIHGHTHRPAIHCWRHPLGARQRVVLGAWGETARYAEACGGRIRLLDFA